MDLPKSNDAIYITDHKQNNSTKPEMEGRDSYTYVKPVIIFNSTVNKQQLLAVWLVLHKLEL